MAGMRFLRAAVLPALRMGGWGAAAAVEREAVEVGHLIRTYYVQYPMGTAPPDGWPLVFSFHGWLSNAGEMAAYDKFRLYGASSAIVVHGEGYSDPSHPGWVPKDRWQSWNGGGSAGEEDGGTEGPICKPAAVVEYNWQCYESCRVKGYCTPSGVGAERCRWSHCEDDVAFVLAMIERIKARAAVDASRVYATGHSNGGVFVYELASDARTAGLFAAIAPVSGLPHSGFNRGTRNLRMRFLDIGGTQDTFVWHFPNVEGDGNKSYGTCCGWYYSNWRNTSLLWAAQKGLEASGMTDIKSRHGLTCQGWSSDNTVENADLGVCFYDGGHVSPDSVWRLTWDFFGIPFTGGVQESTFGLKTVLALASTVPLAFFCARRRSYVKASTD